MLFDYRGDMIQHFILTRSFYRQTDPAFLHYRFHLMRQFCGASLSSQTRQDFTWILRHNLQSVISDEVVRWSEGLPFPVHFAHSAPLPGKDSSDLLAIKDDLWRLHLRRLIQPEATHVLTTRLDDDDIIAPDFVERLRGAVQESETPAAYNFPVGYVLNLQKSGSKARKWRFPQNQFASVISPVDPLVLVNDVKHGDIEMLCPLRLVDENPAFVWTRHRHTKSPGGRAPANIPAQRLARQFPVLDGVS